ncbi:transcription antitermination factor NusB [Sphaerochaeta pleomorpha str. Grapes]|uniref:Transcription antitermination protein NusB n=1 Tax=Sphaerochaeta pleomorpha (strain ATCC BAA-1885 / DSM 22778 / Grapes) TaxID=158190 RepID=G8QVI9_SPHPG|nr:transcription antitermination factor NusB [Sphaerochaeta pleomorpha]AEV28222.1 transcription antitermination factor NusB [Sphaerochaeta pleomorpha str. Grapes]
MKTRHKARELALQTLYAMDFNKELDKDHIPEGFSGMTESEYAELEDEVKIFGRYLINGTIENLEQIDALITSFSLNRPLERIDAVDRNVLRMSVFSFLYGDIHPHIIIDEAVKLSQDFSTEVNYKFINGILDTMQKKLFPIGGKTNHDSIEDSPAN